MPPQKNADIMGHGEMLMGLPAEDLIRFIRAEGEIMNFCWRYWPPVNAMMQNRTASDLAK